MKTALAIFSRDLRRILRNPVALIVTLGVAIIPALYAWFNVAASWDPYGNTSGIKVAVVNADTGTTNDLVGALDAGAQVIDALHDNTQLGWTYEDNDGRALTEDAAVQGVEDGAYYAAIVIPADFSSNLASIASGTFTKPSIRYYINEKRNTVVPEITDVGAETVEGQISEQFISTVSMVVAEKVQELGGKISSEADNATSSVSAQIRDVEAKLADAGENLATINSTVDAAKQATADARGSLDALEGLAGDATTTLDGATNLLGTTRSAALDFSTQLSNSLGRGGSLLATVSGQANAGIGRLTGGVAAAQGAVDGAIATAQGVVDAHDSVSASLHKAYDDLIAADPSLADRLGDLQVALQEFDQRGAEQQAQIDALRQASADVKASNDALANASDTIDGTVQAGVSAAADARAQLDQTTLPQLNGALDSFAATAGDLRGVLGGLSPTVSQARGVLDQLDGTLDQVKDSLGLVDGSLSTVRETLERVATDMDALRNADAMDQLLDLDAEGIGDFMNSPVTLSQQVLYPVGKYGASAAPFYTNLAIWVGGFVLIAIYKQEVDGEGIVGAHCTDRILPWQAYTGRGLLLLLIGQLQALIVCVGDVLMGIQCASPVAFVLAGMVQSLVYVSIVFALAVAFKHVGKALAVVLVILQIPGSSGLYPIEMMPGFFQALEPWLPFTYGIRAMREAIAGFYGNHYAVALLQLLVFLVPALLVGLAARRRLVNINALFDRRLAQTDLMVCEEHALDTGRYKLTSLAKALMDSGDYAGAIARRTARFELMYPRLVRIGLVCLVAVPVGLLVLLFLLEAKLPVLMIWVLSVVLLCSLLIALEYVHDSLARKSVLSRMPRDQVRRLLDDRLAQEAIAAATPDLMRQERQGRQGKHAREASDGKEAQR